MYMFGLHQVKILVFDNYQTCAVPLKASVKFMKKFVYRGRVVCRVDCIIDLFLQLGAVS